MYNNVNLSKFRVPSRQKGFLHRARLIDWMHANTHRKLTFVSAPAGYGKTSLLLDFARDVDARVCWFLLTPGDEDLRKFAWDLLLSIRQIFPEFGQDVEAFLKTNPGAIDHVSLANDFINELIKSIDDFTMLFVDDFHLVADSDEVTGFFELLLDYLPDGVRIIAASRTEFGIPTGKLYARNQINLMNVDQLRFRANELQRLIARAYRIKLNNVEAEALAKRSDGWIVAVMLAANSMQWGKFLEFQGSTEHVYAFLAQDVIERESDQLQQFMLAMSIVDEFDIQIASALFPGRDVKKLIQELELRNLFVSRVETQDGSAYRFHQLFLEFLRHRLEATNYSLGKDLHLRAAEWFENKKDWDNAIFHSLKLGDRETAARLMDYVAKNHFVFGANVRVENWLGILSAAPDMRSLAPELLLNRAKFLVDQNRLSDAEPLLEIADKVFEATGETDKTLNSLSVRGLIFWRRGQYERTRQVVKTAREILSGPIQGSLYPARAHQFDRMESLCDMSKGDFEAGVPGLNKTIQALTKLLNEVQNRVTKIQIVHDLVLSYETLGLFMYQNGQIYASQSSFLDAFELRDKYLRKNQGLVFSLNNIGYIYYQLGEFDKAYRYLTHGLQLLETIEKGQASIHLYNSYADLMRDLDEWDEAEFSLSEAIKLGEEFVARKKEIDISGTYISFMELERVRGNYDKAIYNLHESFRLGKISLDTPEFNASLGSVYHSMGQYDLAIDTLTKADDQFNKTNRLSKVHANVDFLIGSALFQKGKLAEASGFLESAFAQTARMGYDQFLITEGRHTLPFLKASMQALPGLTQIQSVIKRVEDYKTGRARFEEITESESLIPETILLEVSGFGPGLLRLNGETIRKSDWRATMARSLFYYILDEQGKTGTGIKLEFWPDKSGANATSNFQSTLWRARKALKGFNVLVLENNRYVISSDVKVWYDVQEFEALIEQSNRTDISESERLNLLKSAVDIVKGEFLPDLFMEWANNRRIHLHRTYQRALEKLADLKYQRERFNEASEYYEKLMATDPFRDDIVITILKCLKESGSVILANRRYEDYINYLESEGMVPSEELTAYYTSQIRGLS